jgi:plastocyanin
MKNIYCLLSFIIFIALLVPITTHNVQAHGGREVGNLNVVVGFGTEPAYEGILNTVELIITSTNPIEAHTKDNNDHGSHSSRIDLNAHGSIFASTLIDTGQSFSYEVPDELNNLSIPYHDHMNHEITGTIHVKDSSDSNQVKVMIHSGSVMPDEVTVKPGTTITWKNYDKESHAITSGVMPVPVNKYSPVTGLSDKLEVELTHKNSKRSTVLSLSEDSSNIGKYTSNFVPTDTGIYQIRVFGIIDDIEINEIFVSEGDGGSFDDVTSQDSIQFPNTTSSNRELQNALTGISNSTEQALNSINGFRPILIISLIISIVGAVAGLSALSIILFKK